MCYIYIIGVEYIHMYTYISLLPKMQVPYLTGGSLDWTHVTGAPDADSVLSGRWALWWRAGRSAACRAATMG